MMAVWCEGCGAQVLLWPGDLTGIVNAREGAIVTYRCGSGHDGVTLVARQAPPDVPRRSGARREGVATLPQ